MTDAIIAEFMNLIHREVARVAVKYMPGHRFGTISQYDPTGPAVRVLFAEDLDASGEPTLSPWMPIVKPSAGPGAGDIAAPNIGDQALVLHFGWGADRFTFMLGTVRGKPDAVPAMPVNPGDAATQGIPEGDRAIVHKSGTGMFLRGDGAVLAGAGGGTFQRVATEAFVLEVFNNHMHKNVQGGSGVSGPPVAPVDSGDTTNMTVQFKGT